MQDLIVVLDDATTTTMQALRAVAEQRGVFCALYTDRASHFVTTRCANAPHRSQKPAGPTQIQRALGHLGIELIQSYSSQARGRMERLWETWQGRLPMELRLKGINTWEGANEFLATTWLPFHNRTWSLAPQCPESAFVPLNGQDLDRTFPLHHSRVVGNNNCLQFQKLKLQVPPCHWRHSFAKCQVTVYQHLDGTMSIGYGPHTLGHHHGQGRLPSPSQKGGLRLTTRNPSPGSVPSRERLLHLGQIHD